MADATARPQDVGRRHRRRSLPPPESLALLERYRVALRDELGETLTELRPTGAEGLGLVPKGKPALADRIKLWELAMRLARELGADADLPTRPVDLGPPDATRGRAPKLTRRDRARLA